MRKNKMWTVAAVSVAVGAVAITAAAGLRTTTAVAAEITVYKSPTCGCCSKWVEHLRANGFEVTTNDINDLANLKAELGIRPELASCHTAVVDGYVIEGHVPAASIQRLLAERPKVTGISVPGMPVGSPGMEGPNAQRYNVVSFDAAGQVQIYDTY